MNISVGCMDIEEIYPKVKEMGFYGLDFGFPVYNDREIILADEFEDSILKKYKAINDAGLKICQTHLTFYPGHLEPLGDGSYKAYEDYMLPIIIKEIEIIAKMNCKVAAAHLYFHDSKEVSRQGNIELIKKLLPVLEKNDVSLAIENVYGHNYSDIHLSTAEDLLFYTDYFKSEYVGVCLDAGHAVILHQNPIEMIKAINKNLKGLHVHATIEGVDLHLPPYFIAGGVDWKEFYKNLVEVGYKGTFNMEIKAPRDFSIPAKISYYEMVYKIADGIIRG